MLFAVLDMLFKLKVYLPASLTLLWAIINKWVIKMLNTTSIKAITLDLDDTLWPVWPTIYKAEDLMREFLQPNAPKTVDVFANKEQIAAIRKQLIADNPHFAIDLNTLRKTSIHHVLSMNQEPLELVEPAFEVFIQARQQVDLFEDSFAALKRLAAKYKIVALSNGNANVFTMEIGQFFHDAVSAVQAGVAKPDAKIFNLAIDKSGFQAHEILHVGDDAHLDAKAALDLGIQTVWVNRPNINWPFAEVSPPISVPHMAALCDLLGC